MKRSNSRSGSTVAQVWRILLLLGLSFVVVESNGFAQSAQNAAANQDSQLTSVTSPSDARLSEKSSSLASEPSLSSTKPESLSAAAPADAKAISKILIASLESKLQQWQALAGSDQQAPWINAGDTTTVDSAFINQKLEALDRMIKLLEHKQTMQAVAGIYQKRLDDMEKKIEKHGDPASGLKPE